MDAREPEMALRHGLLHLVECGQQPYLGVLVALVGDQVCGVVVLDQAGQRGIDLLALQVLVHGLVDRVGVLPTSGAFALALGHRAYSAQP